MRNELKDHFGSKGRIHLGVTRTPWIGAATYRVNIPREALVKDAYVIDKELSIIYFAYDESQTSLREVVVLKENKSFSISPHHLYLGRVIFDSEYYAVFIASR